MEWKFLGNGYYVSDQGLVFSQHRGGHTLKPGLGTNGRLFVNINRGDKKKMHYIHVLVCKAFHGERPEGLTASHKNGNKLDNRAENLCWETYAVNMARKLVHGTDDRGTKNSRACLTHDTVRMAWTLRSQGLTMNVIASRLGVSRPTISRVLNGLRYQTESSVG